MAYTLTFNLALGESKAGIADLRAQLVDTSDSNVGSAVSTGFSEVGNGFYIWNYASIPDDHRGAVKFYSNATPATFLAVAAINPQEAEYSDIKTSNVWNVLTSAITTTGSIGKFIIDKLGLITGPVSVTAETTADFTITRAITLDGEVLTGITVPGSWTKCYFTVKNDLRNDADTASIIQIVVSDPSDGSDGLLYLNGASATAANGSLSVGASSVTITLEDDATALLSDCDELDYDVKFLIGGTGKSEQAKAGTVDIDLTATRTI